MIPNHLRVSVLCAGLALVAAGCPASGGRPPSATVPNVIALKQGFGKLPKPAEVSAEPTYEEEGIGEAPAVVAPSVPQAPKAEAVGQADSAVGVTAPSRGVAAPSIIARPVPAPYPYPKPRPATIEYVIEAPLPAWGAEGDVLQARKPGIDPNLAATAGSAYGLPSELIRLMDRLTGLNIQWKDRDGYAWSFDSTTPMLTFYSFEPMSDAYDRPTYDRAEAIRIADGFLDAHGLGIYHQSGGEVEEWSWIQPLMKGGAGAVRGDMPCIMGVPGSGASGSAVAETAPAKPGKSVTAAPKTATVPGRASIQPEIYPSPCQWWPPQLTVSYTAKRDNRDVIDAYANPVRAATVSVDVQKKRATSGSVQLTEPVDRSAYPLIDQESARRRLQSGGRNPIWPYDGTGGVIKVRIGNIDLVWMRYDQWKENESKALYFPALLARGTVMRGKGYEPEAYRTVIPLLRDDVFEEAGGDEGGIPTPVPLPAVQAKPAPTPVRK